MANRGTPGRQPDKPATDRLDEEFPRTIAGRYQVVSALGEGGMGAVYRAYDTRLNRPVAIKTIRPEHLASKQASYRFFREARALARLNHPHILTLFDYGQDGDVHYLVMELGGQDLQHLLENQGGPCRWGKPSNWRSGCAERWSTPTAGV